MNVAIAPEIIVADAIRTTRLRQLRRVAGEAPEGRLDMRTWTGPSACGTTRCLAGWATVDPWMRENTPILDLFCIVGDMLYPLVPRRIYDGLASIFGIEARDSRRLFRDSKLTYWYSDSLVTRAMVLRNIDLIRSGRPALLYDCMIDEGIGGAGDVGSAIGDDDDDIDEAEPTGVDESGGTAREGYEEDDDIFEVDDDDDADPDDDDAA